MIESILKHRYISALIGSALFLELVGFIWSVVGMRSRSAGPFILHFNDIEGITQVGGLGTIVAMGIIGAVMIILDFVLAIELAKKEEFLGKMVAWTALILGVLLFIAFSAILKVN